MTRALPVNQEKTPFADLSLGADEGVQQHRETGSVNQIANLESRGFALILARSSIDLHPRGSAPSECFYQHYCVFRGSSAGLM